MQKLQKFYDTRVAEAGDDAFLVQVGHTLGGKPLPAAMAARLADALRAALASGPDDHILDLCCGNGVFTRQLAAGAASATGVDLSAELIRVAQSHQMAGNTRYLQGDVARLDEIAGLGDRRYGRVVMNAGLQHFPPRQFGALLDRILPLCDEAPVLLFALVPERGRERAFFDTPRKRLKRAWLKATGRDIFGHWWARADLEGPARQRGFVCDFPPLDPSLPYAAYRMTVRLARV